MTWYADPAAPRLSDFLIDRRIEWDDHDTMGHWPFGLAGAIPLKVGSAFNPAINRWEAPIPDPALLNKQQWADVVYGPGVAGNWSLSQLLSVSPPVSGGVAARQAAVMEALLLHLDTMGCNSDLMEFGTWVAETYMTENIALGLPGKLAVVDPKADSSAYGLIASEYRALIWTGEAGASAVKTDWVESVAAWFDDKIENDGWRFWKPWQVFPMVRPLVHRGDASTVSSEAYLAGKEDYPIPRHWCMGVDFWSLTSRRIGEKVPWIKFTQIQDLRDPGNADYLITNWRPSVYFTGGSLNRLEVAAKGHDTRNTYLFIETLDGQRPTTFVEARALCGADVVVSASVPGLILESGGYFEWYGWQEPSGDPKTGKSMRLYAIKADSADLMGVASMEDLLAKDYVKLAFTCELSPYSDVGPSVDSTFGVVPFEGEPSGDVRLRLSAG